MSKKPLYFLVNFILEHQNMHFFPQMKKARVPKVRKFGIKYEEKRISNLEACQA